MHPRKRSGPRQPFDQWFAECTARWDMMMGDDAIDYPWLEWRGWYEEGLTVEEAVRRANSHVYGSE